MRYLICLLMLFSTTAQAAGSGGVNAPEMRDRPYLILISIDGFRWDYQDLYDTPALDRIAAQGVRADAMIPVFPTLTFPNHYSIATGLYPANHGLISNKFPSKDRTKFYSLYDRETVQDGAWYGGEPIWVASEKNGLVSAAYFFVGTEAAIDGVHPTYWRAFDAKIPGLSRVDQVLEWLAMPDEQRPHLVTLYFEDVDHATHKFGPGSEQSITSIQRVDAYLDKLMSGIAALPIANEVYIVVVSDHGQSAVNKKAQPFIIDTVADLEGLMVIDHGAVAFIYLPEPDPRRAEELRDVINQSWEHGRAMLRSEVPKSWHVTETAGFADLIVQSDPGYTVFSSKEEASHSSTGDHGWAPEWADMRGIFLASGPRLPKGIRIPPIEAVDVYPLMMEILGLPITTATDGDLKLLPGLLQSFYLGADLSYVNEMEDCGAVYRENGQPRDAFELFADRGANLVRVRIWNDPDWTRYSNLSDVKRTIARSRKAGMQVLLDFHYSDDWADGDKQIIPRAWEGITSDDELAERLYQFTLDTLLDLHREALWPELVQVGNETNPEILRGAESGKEPINWKRNALLFNAGIRAVRDASAQTGLPVKVMLHIAQPENVEAWFEAASQAGVNDFDQIGISYYRRWSSQDLDGLTRTIRAMHARYPAEEIILVETAYPWTLEWADDAPNLLTKNTLIEGYPATPQGQASYLIDLTQRVMDAGGQGMVYWEPAWVSTKCSTRWGQGSHWENATFFDFNNDNEVLPAIDFLNHAYKRPGD